MVIAGFVHRIENTAVNRFQTIAQIRYGTTDDHAHRVIQIRGFHLFFDGNRRAVKYMPWLRIFVRLVDIVVQWIARVACSLHFVAKLSIAAKKTQSLVV